MSQALAPFAPATAAQLPVDRSGARLRRVLFAIAMNPDRFASLEEQIFVLTRIFRERGELFLPLWICDHRTGNPPVYEAAGLRAECLDLHRFRIGTLAKLVRLIRREHIELIQWSFTQPLTNPYLWALSVLTPSGEALLHGPYLGPLAAESTGEGRQTRGQGVSLQAIRQGHRREPICYRPPPRSRLFVGPEDLSPFSQHRAIPSRPGGAGRGAPGVRRVGALRRDRRFLPWLPQGTRRRNQGAPEPAGADSALGRRQGADDSDRLRLQQLCRQLGVADRVRFFGHQPDVERYMQAADCFVCPSRWGEAAGFVNIEAQACGLPAVGSRVGGVPELIQDGRTGFLFPCEDDRQLADKIRVLYEDPARCRAMQRAAREWVVERFSPDSRIDDFLDLYRAPR